MKRTIALILVLLMAFTAFAACGSKEAADTSAWPKQPVNVVVTAKAGGGMDNVIRLMNEYFVKKTGQSFVIDNITGTAGYEKVHSANADSYSFVMGTTTIFTSKADGTLSFDWADYDMVSFLNNPYNSSCIAVQARPCRTL